jgi:hypothetical protein
LYARVRFPAYPLLQFHHLPLIGNDGAADLFRGFLLCRIVLEALMWTERNGFRAD